MANKSNVPLAAKREKVKGRLCVLGGGVVFGGGGFFCLGGW